MCWSAQMQGNDSATAIRREMIHYLELRVAEPESLPDAEIVIGELISNAFRHSPGPICADLVWPDGTRPAVVVHDTGTCFNEKTARPESSSESGRGLFIVRALAHRLSVREVKPRGCMVTAVLRLSKHPRASAEPHPCPRGSTRSEIGCACAMLLHGIVAAADASTRKPADGG